MESVPAAMDVMIPAAFTIAMDVLLDLQVTVWMDASAGVIIAFNVSFIAVPIVRVELYNVIPVTGIMTVTRQVALKLPSCVVATMVSVPAAIAVTTPVELTMAMAVLLDLQE